MGLYWSLLVFMGNYGSSLLLIGPKESLLFFFGSFLLFRWFLWVPIGPYGSLWILMGPSMS